jgi:uncharacterized protein (TIGR02466 family)
MKEFEIFNIFPSTCSIVDLDEELSQYNFLDKIKNNVELRQIDDDFSYKSYVSIRKNILDDFPEIKKIILETFYLFKNNVLKYSDTEFEITTSWVAKFDENSYCHFHNHKNCFYSGVLYLTEHDEDLVGKIEFEKTNLIPNQFYVQPVELNRMNSDVASFTPKINSALFFPAYLRHRVTKHKCKKSRYSLAFNFLPTSLSQEGRIVNFLNDEMKTK